MQTSLSNSPAIFRRGLSPKKRHPLLVDATSGPFRTPRTPWCHTASTLVGPSSTCRATLETACQPRWGGRRCLSLKLRGESGEKELRWRTAHPAASPLCEYIVITINHLVSIESLPAALSREFGLEPSRRFTCRSCSSTRWLFCSMCSITRWCCSSL
jgi:hypothetical protein